MEAADDDAESACSRSPMQNHPYIWNYLPLLLQILVAVGMTIGMVNMSFLIGRHRNIKEKLEAYECGIPAEGDARGRFSVRFYMVAMLFILFDVEAVFMMPWAVVYRELPKLTGSQLFGFWEMLVYLGFVVIGVFYVWKKGILDWAADKADL
jgi:NADH-quinone oxidoreductase subunit A